MSRVHIDLQMQATLALPQTPLSAARLVSGAIAVVCQGRSPETVLAMIFEWPQINPAPQEAQRPRALIQLGGASSASVVANHGREEALVLACGGDEQALYAIDDERPLWRLLLERGEVFAPVCADATTFLAEAPATLTALDLEGEERWSVALPAPATTSPAWGCAEGVALGTEAGLAWVTVAAPTLIHVDTAKPVRGLAVSGGGRLWSHDGATLSCRAWGEASPMWTLKLPAEVSGEPMAVDARGHVYVPAASGGVMRVSAQGEWVDHVLRDARITDLRLDPCGAMVGVRRDDDGNDLIAWPLPGRSARPGAALPHRLPSSPVAVMTEAHQTTVLCEDGELLCFRLTA